MVLVAVQRPQQCVPLPPLGICQGGHTERLGRRKHQRSAISLLEYFASFMASETHKCGTQLKILINFWANQDEPNSISTCWKWYMCLELGKKCDKGMVEVIGHHSNGAILFFFWEGCCWGWHDISWKRYCYIGMLHIKMIKRTGQNRWNTYMGVLN